MPGNSEHFVLTVSQLNDYVKSLTGSDPLLRGLCLKGEISNFKRHSSGHLYFSLKDENALIRCVMFRPYAVNLDFRPADGQQVLLTGYVSFYTRDGQLQFYCEKMQADGKGALYRQFERNKARFEEEGLFDPSHRRPLPALCRRIGVATSPTGAVLRDIIRVAHRRNPSVEILLAPCRVQGEGAAREIAAAVERLNREDLDVILVGRGGGSLEDLWAFNEEEVVRAVRFSRLPVISAVGHETDFALCDFAADVRASTPSNAAELAVADLREAMQRLDRLSASLDAAALRAPKTRQKVLDSLCARLSPSAALRHLAERERDLSEKMHRMSVSAEHRQKREEERLSHLTARLNALDPEAVLRRGYALIEAEGRTLSTVSEVRAGQDLAVRLQDGRLMTKVIRIEEAYEKNEL